MKGYRKKLGQWGEELALEFYRARGYELLDKNWQKRSGEIDLIVTKGRELVFVEVKTRTTKMFGYGEEAVTPAKRQKIRKTIAQFLRPEQFKEYYPRFDVVVVEFEGVNYKIVHFENVEL